MAKIGINGFGRIGRLVLRAAMEKALNKCGVTSATEIVSINDAFLTTQHMAYLFSYDSNIGKYPGVVTTTGNCLMVDGHRIETFNEKIPDKIPWAKNCVDYVIDATGAYLTCEKASLHLKGGAKRVLITAPSSDAPTFVVGVNHSCFDAGMKVISCASPTTNAVATLLKVLHDNYDVADALMTTIHAVTGSQRPVDMGAKKWRRGRGALQNIVPSSTGCVETISKVIPELEGKITGIALRVPVPVVCIADLSVRLNKETSMDSLKCNVKKASDSYMKGLLGYTEDPVVSSDFIGDPRSAIFDAGACVALSKCFVKVFAWYDNEAAYSSRVLEMANYMHSREQCN